VDKKIFFTEKNFISKDECLQLIDFYNKNIQNSYRYYYSFPLDTTLDKNFLKTITEKIEKICHKFVSNCKLDTRHIVRWPEGSKMPPHYDPPSDVLACLIYLNDDYIGGETCFENNFLFEQEVKPEIGKLVVFSNSEILHWVNEVKEGTRYTLALWFVSK
jgi:hypothetical protein